MQSANYPEFAARLAPFVENFAARSLERLTVDELVGKIKSANMQVWVCGDFQAVALTSVSETCVTVECCSGSDRMDWQDDLDAELTAWARHLGKKRLFLMARPGWSKRAKQIGYVEKHREMCKELN